MMNDILVQNFTSVHSLENNIWNIRKFEILEKNICQKKNLALLAQKIGEQKIVKRKHFFCVSSLREGINNKNLTFWFWVLPLAPDMSIFFLLMFSYFYFFSSKYYIIMPNLIKCLWTILLIVKAWIMYKIFKFTNIYKQCNCLGSTKKI